MGFENSAGLSVRNQYGPRVIKDFGGEVTTGERQKELEIVFNYDDLPAAGVSLGMEGLIPEGSYISSARVQTIIPFVGGTSYDIGLYDSAGVAIDANGLFAALLTADINVVNEWSIGAGALIANDIGLTDDGYLVAAATGTFTAGKMRVLVEYREADFDATGNYTAGGVKGAG